MDTGPREADPARIRKDRLFPQTLVQSTMTTPRLVASVSAARTLVVIGPFRRRYASARSLQRRRSTLRPVQAKSRKQPQRADDRRAIPRRASSAAARLAHEIPIDLDVDPTFPARHVRRREAANPSALTFTARITQQFPAEVQAHLGLCSSPQSATRVMSSRAIDCALRTAESATPCRSPAF